MQVSGARFTSSLARLCARSFPWLFAERGSVVVGGGLAIARAGGLAGLHREQGWEAGKGGGAEDYADKVGFLLGGKSVRSRSSHTSSRSVSQFLFSFHISLASSSLPSLDSSRFAAVILSYSFPFLSFPFVPTLPYLSWMDGRVGWIGDLEMERRNRFNPADFREAARTFQLGYSLSLTSTFLLVLFSLLYLPIRLCNLRTTSLSSGLVPASLDPLSEGSSHSAKSNPHSLLHSLRRSLEVEATVAVAPSEPAGMDLD